MEIRSLLEFSRLINQSDSLDVIYGALLLSLMGKLRTTRGAIAVSTPKGGLFVVEHARGGVTPLLSERLEFATSSETIAQHGITEINTGSSGGTAADATANAHGLLRGTEKKLSRYRLHSILPVRNGSVTYALVLLGPPFAGERFTEEERNYAMVLASMSAIAIEGALMKTTLNDINRRLERRVRRLHSVFESTQAFAGLIEFDRIVSLLGYTLMGEMALTRFALYLTERNGSARQEVNGSRAGNDAASESARTFRRATNRFSVDFSQDDLKRLHQLEPGLLNEAEWPELMANGVRAAIPLHSQGATEGLLLIGDRVQYDIDGEDVEFLAALGSMALAALENSRLIEETIEKERLEEDLRIAWEIQQGLLPDILPNIQGYDIAGETNPARHVGGDCYDVIQLPDGTFLITIADGSGKGAPASLLMATFQAAVRALAPLGLPLGELACRVNNLINDNTAPDKFITAFLALLNPSASELTYVNAGHNWPLLRRGDEFEHLKEGGILFGIMPVHEPYPTDTVTINQGDTLLIYTDGVTEARDEAGAEYGEERLTRMMRANPTLSAPALLHLIRQDLANHAYGTARWDDVTMICLTRESS